MSSSSRSAFQFNRHQEELASRGDSDLLLSLFFSMSSSPAIAREDNCGEFGSPVEEPPSPTSFLVRPQEIQEELDDDEGEQPGSSGDDRYEEAESSSRRSSAKKQTLGELMNFESSRQQHREEEEEEVNLLTSKQNNNNNKHHRSLLLQAACKCTRDHCVTPKSRFSTSSTSSSTVFHPPPPPPPPRSSLKNSPMSRSKSTATFTSRGHYRVNLTKSKSLGAAAYVVRVDQTGGSSSSNGGGGVGVGGGGVPRINQQPCSSSGRKSSVTMGTPDSMAVVMERYQQRIKDEKSRKQGSSYLPYKRALLSLFVPLPSLWSRQQQQQHHHHHQPHFHQLHHTVDYST